MLRAENASPRHREIPAQWLITYVSRHRRRIVLAVGAYRKSAGTDETHCLSTHPSIKNSPDPVTGEQVRHDVLPVTTLD